MRNVEKAAYRRRRLRNFAAFATFIGVCATALAAVVAPASADTQNAFSEPKMRSKTEVQSVYISGKGHSISIHGEDPANPDSQIVTRVGSESAPVGLDACYTYWEGNDGEFVAGVDMYTYVNQAPGRQDTRTKKSKRDGDVQFAHPYWLRGSTMNINTFSSPDCTAGLVNQFKNVTVPDNGVNEFELHLK